MFSGVLLVHSFWVFLSNLLHDTKQAWPPELVRSKVMVCA